MAYELIEKYKYPAYDEYVGRAEKCSFAMNFGPAVSSSSLVSELVAQCEQQAEEDGAVMLGLEIWEESTLLNKKYKCTAYAYRPSSIDGLGIPPVVVALVPIILKVLAWIAIIFVVWLISKAVTSVAEIDWEKGGENIVDTMQWAVYGIAAVGVIILGSILLRKQRK